jgi:uncharacterized protein YndB with AHSA1/START domain
MQTSTLIDLERQIDAPASSVFEAISRGELFKATGIVAETFEHDFRAGGNYRLEWRSGGKCAGRYLEIIPRTLIAFSWNSTDCDSATNKDTRVTVSLLDQQQGCTLRLTHEGLDEGLSHADHLNGWTSSLDDFQESVRKA